VQEETETKSFFLDAFPNTELTYDWKSENAVIVGESSIATQYILDKAITSIEDVYFKSTSK
jgi:hypothetical protein